MIYSLHKKKRVKKLLLGGIVSLGTFWLYLLSSQAIRVYWLSNTTVRTTGLVDFSKETSEQLRKHHLQANIIEEQPNMIRLVLRNNITVLLAKNKSIEKQMEALQAIINQDKIDSRPIREIDLRFRNPVIRY